VTIPFVAEERHPDNFGWRQRAGAFWLGLLFALADRLPGIARAIRPVVIGPAWFFSRKIRRNTAANGRRILGRDVSARRLRQFGIGVTGCFYDVVCDIGRSSRCGPEALIGRIESVEGLETYRGARAAGKGAVVLTAHMGSFEVGLAALGQYEADIHVVFQRDPFVRFEQLRAALRRRLGVKEAVVDEGWPMWVRLRDALQRDEVVTIQGDRVMPQQKGIKMAVSGGHVMLPPGPFKLALAAGAPIIPIFSIRGTADKIRIFIEPAIQVEDASGGDPVGAAMRAWAGVLEKYVARYPEQWLILEKAFCEEAEEGSPATCHASLEAGTTSSK
jgi:KDO2-lipid IV(A) lauroyltransferase